MTIADAKLKSRILICLGTNSTFSWKKYISRMQNDFMYSLYNICLFNKCPCTNRKYTNK